MDNAAWEAKVARLSQFAVTKPRAYRLRVGALAGLGYLYLVIAVLLLVGIAVALAAASLILLKLAIFFLAFAYAIVRSLWVRLPPPEGVRATRTNAPQLWRLVDQVRDSLDARPVHEILMSDDLNAGVVQIPRIGIFGWQKNYLMIGLPLMQALSEDEFRGVIAHELGHLSGNHSRFAGWIYRVRKTWTQLLVRLEQERRAGAVVFRKFFEWYAPYFSAYSFALARSDEFAADRAAVEAVGARAAGTGLVRVNAAAAFLGIKWWPSVFERVRAESAPPTDVYKRLSGALPAAAAHEEAVEWVQEALQRDDGFEDTHPPLPVRLKAMGVDPEELVRAAAEGPAPNPTAAQVVLGGWEQELVAQFQEDWLAAITEDWQAEHEQTKEDEARLGELEAGARSGPAARDDIIERALLTTRLRSDDEGLPLLRAALKAAPDDAVINFTLGRVLLDRGDEAGLMHVDTAINLEAEAVLPGCEIAYAFLTERGENKRAERYRERAEARMAILQAAAAERAELTTKDDVVPHDLPPDQVEALRQQLARLPEVKVAYVARKKVEHEQEWPLYVIGAERRRHTLKPESSKADSEFAEKLANTLELPFEFFVMPLTSETKNFTKRLRKLPGAQVYAG